MKNGLFGDRAFKMLLYDLNNTLIEGITSEELISKLGLGNFRPISGYEENKIDKKFLEEIGFDISCEKGKYQVLGLIGDKGFLVSLDRGIIDLGEKQNQILKKEIYKKTCLEIIKSVREEIKQLNDINGDAISILEESIDDLKNIKRIDYLDMPDRKVIKKIIRNEYIDSICKEGYEITLGFENGLPIIKKTKKVEKKDFDDFLMDIEDISYLCSFEASNYGEAKIINDTTIDTNSDLGKLKFKHKLPNKNLKPRVYLDKFRCLCCLNEPFYYKARLNLIFLEGQDRLFKK